MTVRTASLATKVGLALVGVLACGLSPAAEPGEVMNLRIADDDKTFSWDTEPLADTYNVYRGYLTDLAPDFYGTFLDAEIAGTTYVDPTPPGVTTGSAGDPITGPGFFYLVTAVNADGEGTLGQSNPLGGGGTNVPTTSPGPVSPWPGSGRACGPGPSTASTR